MSSADSYKLDGMTYWMAWLTGFRLLCSNLYFYASGTKKLWCRRHNVFVCVHLWVCVSWRSCEHHISKTDEGNFAKFWS